MSSISSRILGFFKPKQQQEQQEQQQEQEQKQKQKQASASTSSCSSPPVEDGGTHNVNDDMEGDFEVPDVDPTMVDQGSSREGVGLEMEGSLMGEGVLKDLNQSCDLGSRVTQEIKVSGEGISLFVEVQGSSVATGGGGVVQETGSGVVVSKENLSSTTCEVVREGNNGTHSEISLPEDGEKQVEGLGEMMMMKNDVVEEGEKKEVGGGEGLDELTDHGFSVGDFVWGKTKLQHWWPGQIYSPSDASKYAAKCQQKNQLLVGFFGNQSYGWCYPSELRPFQENFEEMLLQSKSKKLHSAVGEALNEVGRIVESEMTCSCVPMEAKIGLVRPLAVNPGIKGGVVVPDCGINDFLINHFQPVKFLAVLRYIAEVVAPINLLEVTVFRRQLAAFNRSRGCRQLPMYQLIPEDDSAGNGVASGNGFDGQTGDSNSTPTEEDWLASPRIRGFGKTSKEKWPGISEDKLYQRKKQRTMVDIMADDMDVEPENGESDAAEEENIGKPMSSSKKRKKNEVETDSYLAEDGSGSGNSISPSKKKKDTKISESPSEMANQDESNAGSADVGGCDGNNSRSLTRERKKSKYLSPPYTNLGSGNKNWIFPSDSGTETPKLPKASRESRAGDKMKRALHQLSGSPSIVKCSSGTFHKKPSEESISYGTPEQKKLVFKLASDEMFFEFLAAALDPMYLKDNDSSRSVKSFFTRYRSSLYLDGANYMSYNDYLFSAEECDEKGKVSDQKNSSPVKDALEPDHPTSNDKSEPNRTEVKDEKMLQSPNNEPKRMKRKYEKKSQYLNGEPKSLQVKDEKLSQSSNSEPTKNKRKYEKKLQSPNSSEPYKIKRKYVKKLQSPDSEPKGKRRRRNSRDEKMSQGPNNGPENVAGTVDIKQNQSGTSGAALLVNFASGVSLPSKGDLVTVFGKFGPLNESETEVLQDSGCARVVYTRSSDAEAAFNSSEKSSPFGPPDLVSYRLQYLPTTSRATSDQHLPGASEHGKNSHQLLPTPIGLEKDGTPANQPMPQANVGEVPPIQFVKEKLQMMTSMLEKAGDDLLPDVKAKLENEIKGLLKKVTTKGDSSS